jgi:D-3-phosphoglycerate dehydrogenase / 2-oxoglutarate reductase
MKTKVLVSAPYLQPVIGRFKGIFRKNNIELVVPRVKERLKEKELLKIVPEISGVICGDDEFTKRVLKSASNLKVISKWGTGIDSIDLRACKKRSIIVCRTPAAFTDPVADTVMACMLSFARKVPQIDKDMKRGKWHKTTCISLKECSLGVIGVGNIGKAIVTRAVSFGMKVMGNDIVNMPKKFVARTGIKMVSKRQLLKKSDFISLNCDLNPTSLRLIGRKELAMMKKEAYVINTARGPIIDEGALIKALKQKKIAGAVLDVFETEPLPKNSPLRSMENVILAPHNANSSPRCWEKVHVNTINNLLKNLHRSRK